MAARSAARRSGTVFMLITKAFFLLFCRKNVRRRWFAATIVSFCGEECNAGANLPPKRRQIAKKVTIFSSKRPVSKIDIFSGFLGAGKTTLIKKLIKEAFAGQKVVLIENEFGEIGIDGGFPEGAASRSTS